jgi:uncharacterized protein (TIGR02271 family)
MTYEDQTTSKTNTISAFFDSKSDADHAVERLVDAGISRSAIQVIEGGSVETVSSASTTESTGFWASLENFFFPDEDRNTYAEGLRRGGYLVTLTGYPFDMHDIALDILDDEGSIDMDERAQAWESEGWSRTGSIDTPAVDRLDTAEVATAQPSRLGADGDEVIPVVQEELRVGKRDVNNGRVRVRSYVSETPVQENVSLRDENVEITRRTVDRPLTGTENAFVDRTIEAEEHREEAVVSKEARVVEEIGLRKTADQRDETISDTVRKTEVEIEDERGEGTVRKDGTLGIRRD